MDCIETSPKIQDEISDSPSEYSLKVLLGPELTKLLESLENDSPITPTAEYCPGTLAAFFTNRRSDDEICRKCPKQSTCQLKHALAMSRVEAFYSDCFGDKPASGWSQPEPAKCRNCFLNHECADATAIMTTATTAATGATTVSSLPASPAPAKPADSAPRSEAATFPSDQELAPALAVFADMTNDDVIASLRATSEEIRQDGATNYTQPLRVQFLAASIELNSRGAMPAFRPACRAAAPKKGTPYSPSDTALSNDLRMIDLDYIAKHHPHGHGEIFDGLLDDGGKLDHGKAWAFVTRKGAAAKKAQLLILTPNEQAELFIIRDNKTGKRWERLRENERKHKGMIRAALNAGRKADDTDDTDQHWQLYALCQMLNWSVKEVVKAATRVPGLTMSESTIRRKIPWLTETAKLPRTGGE